MDTTNQQLREDRDLLIELRTEVKGIRQDVRDLKDGMSRDIMVLKGEVQELKDWRIAHEQSNKDYSRDMGNYFKLIIGVGLVVIGFLVWQSTGYKI